MARLTVENIMQAIASLVNQEASAPTAGGSEYNLWLEFINRGVREWAEAEDWEELKKTFVPSVTGVSQASVALPLDFNKLAAAPRLHIYGDIEGGTEYPDINEEVRGLHIETDKYVTLTGDNSSGRTMVFHPGTLSSGASVEILYYSQPTSLASPAQIPLVPDPEYLIDRTTAYIFEGRSDARFQQQETKAREKLLSMVENHNRAKYNSYGNPQYVMNAPMKKQGFRIGRD